MNKPKLPLFIVTPSENDTITLPPPSEKEIYQSTVIKGIKSYANRIRKVSKGAKSTVKINADLDAQLNAITDILGITRQQLTTEALYQYIDWEGYARHIKYEAENEALYQDEEVA